PFPFWFIARRQEHERWMIAVSLNHSIGFVVKHLLHRSAGADLIPHPRFWLQVEPELICSFKGCFRWTPRMKAHVVESPSATRLKEFFPICNISGRISGKWKIASAVRAPKDDWPVVQSKLVSHCAEFTQTNF